MNKHLNKFIRKLKNKKYIFTFLLYILYQCEFLIVLLNKIGVNVDNFPRPLRITMLYINDAIYVILLLFLYRKEIKDGINKLKTNYQNDILLSLKCWTFGCVVMFVSTTLISWITNKTISNNEDIVRRSISLAPIYMLFSCSIMAPLFEELIFRKSLREIIKKKWLYIISSGVIFGLLHIIGNYTGPIDFLYIIPYGVMGCSFAYLYYKTDNIVLPITVHMIHNFILVLVQILGR